MYDEDQLSVYSQDINNFLPISTIRLRKKVKDYRKVLRCSVVDESKLGHPVYIFLSIVNSVLASQRLVVVRNARTLGRCSL